MYRVGQCYLTGPLQPNGGNPERSVPTTAPAPSTSANAAYLPPPRAGDTQATAGTNRDRRVSAHTLSLVCSAVARGKSWQAATEIANNVRTPEGIHRLATQKIFRELPLDGTPYSEEQLRRALGGEAAGVANDARPPAGLGMLVVSKVSTDDANDPRYQDPDAPGEPWPEMSPALLEGSAEDASDLFYRDPGAPGPWREMSPALPEGSDAAANELCYQAPGAPGPLPEMSPALLEGSAGTTNDISFGNAPPKQAPPRLQPPRSTRKWKEEQAREIFGRNDVTAADYDYLGNLASDLHMTVKELISDPDRFRTIVANLETRLARRTAGLKNIPGRRREARRDPNRPWLSSMIVFDSLEPPR